MVPVTEPHSLPRCIQVFQQGSLFSRGLPLACVQCFEYQGQVRREGSSEQSAQVAIWPDECFKLTRYEQGKASHLLWCLRGYKGLTQCLKCRENLEIYKLPSTRPRNTIYRAKVCRGQGTRYLRYFVTCAACNKKGDKD
eukprot:1161311-Pelagomonas_calceolata.AAC.2